jgi:hypothetical protein
LDPSSYSLIDQKLRPVENIEKEEKARRILKRQHNKPESGVWWIDARGGCYQSKSVITNGQTTAHYAS